MADSPTLPEREIRVTVRYFAAARQAAAAEAETVLLPAGTSVAGLIASLAGRNASLAAVLRRCSYLCDGIAVQDQATTLGAGNTVDVLPPFSGG